MLLVVVSIVRDNEGYIDKGWRSVRNRQLEPRQRWSEKSIIAKGFIVPTSCVRRLRRIPNLWIKTTGFEVGFQFFRTDRGTRLRRGRLFGPSNEDATHKDEHGTSDDTYDLWDKE
jgi:hypothetical protein